MFQMTKEDAMNTLKNYSMLMSRVKEGVHEIGFLDKEFDTLDINKTHFTKDSVHVVAYDGHYDMYDSVSCKFPLEFLFEPAEMHKDWYKEKREAEEKKKQAEKEEAEKKESNSGGYRETESMEKRKRSPQADQVEFRKA